MSVPCGQCGGFVAYGATRCGACQNSLVTELVPGSDEAACATHPERRALQPCARCGAFACLECLRSGADQKPVCFSCAERVGVDLLPWDRRSELGTLRAFWQTCWGTISRPAPFFEPARPEGTIGSSVLFALLASIAGFVPTMLFYVVLFSFTAFLGEESSGNQALLLGIFGAYAVFLPLFAVGYSFVNAGIDHLVLKALGEKQDFGVTYRGLALSMGPQIFGVVPVCSLYVVPIWVLVVRVFAYKGLHKTTGGRAAAGALVSAGVCCFMWIGAVGVLSIVGQARS